MSSIMNDIERMQESVSTMLADWLRQIFTALFLLLAMVVAWIGSFRSSVCSYFRLWRFLQFGLGKKIRSTTRHAARHDRRLNQILQETITGHQVVKSFGAEDFESKRFRAGRPTR